MEKIVFASDLELCDCCEEPYCAVHDMHYADCDCIGPGNAEDEGYEVVEVDGELYAKKP